MKLLSLISVGVVVIQGPDVVIYRPNEAPVELVCNNTGGGSTGWRVNGSSAVSVADIRDRQLLPDHTVNGINLVIVNATNNTEYICVSVTDDGNANSDPVVLYIAGMLYHNAKYV